MNRALSLAALLITSTAFGQADVIIPNVPEGTHYLKLVVVGGRPTVTLLNANVAPVNFGSTRPPTTTPIFPPPGQPPVVAPPPPPAAILSSKIEQLTAAALAGGGTAETAIAFQRLLGGTDDSAGLIHLAADGKLKPADAAGVAGLGMDMVFLGVQGTPGRPDGGRWIDWRADVKFELAKLNLGTAQQTTAALRDIEDGIKAAVEKHFAGDVGRAKAIDLATILRLIELILKILADRG